MIPTSIAATGGLAAAGALIVTGWSYIKSFSRYITGMALLQKTCSTDIAECVSVHLRQHYKRLPSGVSRILSIRELIDDRQYRSIIPFDMPNSTTLWWGPRGAFLVTLGGDAKLVSLRKFSDPYGLICDALDGYDDRQNVAATTAGNGNFYVRMVIGTVGESRDRDTDSKATRKNTGGLEGSADSDPSEGGLRTEAVHRLIDKSFRFEKERYTKNRSNRDPLRGLFYPEEVMTLMSDLDRWFRQRQWYQDRGIPWRTGVMLHGPGGTGKSSLSKAIAQKFGIPLYQYCMNTLSDRDFVHEWEGMTTPCVVALEDFDTVFHGRESTTPHKSLSFECVLNQISGISALSGVLLMVTTNNLHHIDPALGQLDANGRPTRPGRIDRILHMGNATEGQRRAIANYGLDFAGSELIERIVAEHVGTTAAQFQNICTEMALAYLQENADVIVEEAP